MVRHPSRGQGEHRIGGNQLFEKLRDPDNGDAASAKGVRQLQQVFAQARALHRRHFIEHHGSGLHGERRSHAQELFLAA
ncbi:hypothetical protein GCM10025857_26300 [Alicyclobacillus contaminans]|nr:hypothetical protein GCM10025857_26300 [Alicyclobacillus contaminans]